MYTNPFVTFAEHTHLDLFSGKVQLDVQNAFLTDEVFFFNSNRSHDKPDTGRTQVDGLAREKQLFAGPCNIVRVNFGGKANLNGKLVFFPHRRSSFDKGNAESGN